jgi:hypothetical protein
MKERSTVVERVSIITIGGMDMHVLREPFWISICPYSPRILWHRFFHAIGQFSVDQALFSFYDLSKFRGRGLLLIPMTNFGFDLIINLNNLTVVCLGIRR